MMRRSIHCILIIALLHLVLTGCAGNDNKAEVISTDEPETAISDDVGNYIQEDQSLQTSIEEASEQISKAGDLQDSNITAQEANPIVSIQEHPNSDTQGANMDKVIVPPEGEGVDEYGFALDRIREFIWEAELIYGDVCGSEDLGKVIGSYDGVGVFDYISVNNTFDQFVDHLSDYYSEQVIEMKLNRSYLVNLFGEIGSLAASGENIYGIEETSKIYYTLNSENKKIVEIEGFNDFDEMDFIEYTLEKQDSGGWLITKIADYLTDHSETETIIERFYLDFTTVRASSQLDGFSAINIIDEQEQLWPRTAWVEGADGDGTGEWILLELGKMIDVYGINIINGYSTSIEEYYDNNRVKILRIEFSDKSYSDVELVDGEDDFQNIVFNQPVTTTTIKLTILEVYQGDKYDDTAISEIRVLDRYDVIKDPSVAQ